MKPPTPFAKRQHGSSNEARIRARAEEAAAAFPALLVEAERIAHTVAAGLHGRRRAGPGETFWQHRAYIFGDPVSAIDWRQSARAADRLYIRQNEWEAAAAVWIWRDPSRSLDYASDGGPGEKPPTKRRRCDVLATALAILLSQAGERIGLIGGRARPFHGRGAPARFLEALYVDAYDETASAPPLETIQSDARILLISDFFTDQEAIARAAEHYAAMGVTGALLQVTDPAEEVFPFSGRTEFQDAEGPDRLLFGDAGALGGAYRREFAAHRGELENLCRRLGWRFMSHRTDNPPQQALLSLFTILSDLKAAH